MLCAIKLHKEDDYLISFSGDGYSFNIVIPLKGKDKNKIYRFMDKILNHSIKYDAIIYLAKDEYLPKDIFKIMYPKYNDFLKIKNNIDPNDLFQSDMYRRLLKD